MLEPLSPDDLRRLVDDALSGAAADHDELARLVHEKTGGNPFFAIQFLATLGDEHLLTLDTRSAVWRADLNAIRTKGFADNVVDLMVRKLHRLPRTTQERSAALSCVGNTTASDAAALVLGVPEDAMHTDLWPAMRDGLLLRIDGTYRFLHDRVQEAAYSLIPVDQRTDMHLQIGRRLVANLPAHDIADRVFDIVNQLNLGVSLITDLDERELIAELNVRAARKARGLHGIRLCLPLLRARHWPCWIRSRGNGATISRSGFGSAARSASSSPDICVRPSRCCIDLLPRARATLDEGAVHGVLVELYVVACDYPKAVESALACLRLFGIEIPRIRHPRSRASRMMKSGGRSAIARSRV